MRDTLRLPAAFRCTVNSLVPPFLGEESERIEGHPQTLGRDESLHPLGIPDLEIAETNKGLRPSARPGGSRRATLRRGRHNTSQVV